MLPFFRVARTAAAYVAPAGLGAPCAMQAIMIASATRSALALVLPWTRARQGRDQGETRARSQAGTHPGGESGTCAGPVHRERATAMYWYPGCDPMQPGCDRSIYLPTYRTWRSPHRQLSSPVRVAAVRRQMAGNARAAGAQRMGRVTRVHAEHTGASRVTHTHGHVQRLCMSNPLHLGSESGVSAGCGKGGAQYGLDAFGAEEVAGTASPGFHRVFLGRSHSRSHNKRGDSRGVGGCHADQCRPACDGASRPAVRHAGGQSEMAEWEQRQHCKKSTAGVVVARAPRNVLAGTGGQSADNTDAEN